MRKFKDGREYCVKRTGDHGALLFEDGLLVSIHRDGSAYWTQHNNPTKYGTIYRAKGVMLGPLFQDWRLAIRKAVDFVTEMEL